MNISALPAGEKVRVGNVRWIVVALLFSAMIFNYFDRQMLAVLKPTLSVELHWTETQYANMVFWFQAAYAVSYLFFGGIVNRIGARLGFALTFLIWSIAQIAHGAVRSATGFMLVRTLLGIGEGGAYPAGLTAIADWFPRQERAFAIGLCNAGINIGAIITPLIVPVIVLNLGWRAAFILTGVVSLAWLAMWLLVYRSPKRHKGLKEAERTFIASVGGPDEAVHIPWSRLLRTRQAWAYAAGKFLIDPIFWMFLFWLPDFLHKRYGLDLQSFGPPLVVIYLMSDAGNLLGGWASSELIRRGLSTNSARKLTMLVCALLATPIAFAMNASNVWQAVGIIGLATAAHQAFSVNLFTLPADLFPREAVGSVVGFGGALGAVGGMLMAQYAGWILERLGSYTPIFVVASCAYLTALLVIHILSPRLQPVPEALRT